MSGGLVAVLRLARADFTLDVDLTVEPGETLVLVGPNGAGKSTIVELLAGMTALEDRGVIRLDGVVLDDPANDRFVPPERRRAGVVFQQHLLFEHLSARANVAFGLRAGGLDRRSADERALRWLEALDVGHLADRRPAQLSGGQAQRVAIARTLAVEPALLLLDEPLAALDVETRVAVRRTLRTHLADFDRPALLITHDATDALLLADRIAVIEHGRLTQVGPPDEIRRRPATRYVASLAGTNLVRGTAHDGEVTVDVGAGLDGLDVEPEAARGPAPRLRVAETDLSGPVLCSIRPEAISLHTERPSGSQRNVWSTTVQLLEPMGDTTRVTVGAPLPLAVDVTSGSVGALDLREGSAVWVAVKATEIAVRAD